MLFPPLQDPSADEALAMPDGAVTRAQLVAAADAVAAHLTAGARVALWADASLATVVGLVGALRAGAPVVTVNPKSGRAELRHVLGDAAPEAVLAGDGVDLPDAFDGLPRITPDPGAAAPDAPAPAEPDPDTDALIIYTSGTTGPPKGVVQTRASLIANLDALFDAWAWAPEDRLTHALPLFHVHGLVLGTIGPLRRGSHVRHLGGFTPAAVAGALRDGATMLFGVPTMYHRLAAEAEADAGVAAALGGARLLVSGSAALSAEDHRRIERATGQQVVERYGMTETVMITAVRADGERRPGYVGAALPGVVLRVLADDGTDVPADDEAVGDVLVRTPSRFREYLNRPDATAEVIRDGWFATGDVGCLSPDGYLRLVGRRSTDLIKSGGYRIGAGEIELALTAHPAVAEAAVLGVEDPDLGQRIVAWIVPAGEVEDRELIDHVARELTAHKRPREIHRVDALPRNAMGKVQKARLLAR